MAAIVPARLPTDRPYPKRATYRTASLRWDLEPALVESLRSRARAAGATTFTVLAAAAASVVGRATSSSDVCVGMLTSGRNDALVHDLVGCFLNVLPLRIDLSGEPIPSELVRRTRRTIDEAFAHDAPYDAILRALARPRTEGPLYEVSLVMEVRSTENDATFAAEWTPNEHEPAAAPPLTFNFIEHGEHLTCRILYKVELFDEPRIAALRQHFVELLQGP